MDRLRPIACIVAVLLATAATATASPYRSYSYSLDVGVPGGNGGLTGTGAWADGPASISWQITQETPTGNWHYRYVLNVPYRDISHLIIETSESFDGSNLWNVDFNGCRIELDDNFGTAGNPNIPGGIGGIKFDETWGRNNVTFEFDSDRMPVWGDFYAKGGQAALWNDGFDANEPPGDDYDPWVAAYDGGSEQGHILVPDTYFGPPPPPPPPPGELPIPEPATAATVLLGGVALRRYLVSRRRS